MKSLFNIIQEKLKIGSTSKISDDKEILNKNINNIDELHDVIEQYFKSINFDFIITKVNPITTKWQSQYKANKFTVDAHFDVNIFKDIRGQSIRTTKLRFAEYQKTYFVMQVLIYNKDKTQYGRIHGASTYNEFKIGENLLDFLETIIQHTKENHPVDKDPNLVEIFKDIK